MFVESKSSKMLDTEVESLRKQLAQLEKEYQQTKKTLQETEHLMRSVADDIAVGVVIQGPNTEILFANQAAADMIGISRHKLTGKSSFDPNWLPLGEDNLPLPRECQPVPRAIASGQPVRDVVLGIYRPRRKDKLWFLVNAFPQLHPDGTVARVVCSFSDITARKQAEETLRKSQEQAQLVAKATSHIIWDWDLVNNQIWWNEGVETLLGYPMETVTNNLEWWAEKIHPDDRERTVQSLQAAIAAGQESWSEEYRFRCYDGSYLDIFDNGYTVYQAGRPVRMVGGLRDISGRKQLEEQFRQAQKMEAVGRLTGGIAHDFNNLLTVIVSYTEFLLEELSENDPRHDYAQEIASATNRASSLTRQLLAFSRQQVLQPSVLNINTVVADLEKLLRRLIGEDVDLNTFLDPKIDLVKADIGQLEQVMMNLVINSRDAMPEGGKLTIETANVYLDESYAEQHMEVKPGAYVMLAVSDTGCGMDAKTIARIFEPFFTTKEPGKGTGLGLATVHGIVKQSGGHIWVYSELRCGTTFKIYLPRISESSVPSPLEQPPETSLTGTGTILLVEDDNNVRNATCNVLKKQGYTVLEADNSEAALQTATLYNGQIDLLLTDLMLPGGINGSLLATQLVSLYPKLKVLFISGYTNNSLTQNGLLSYKENFIQKPFGVLELSRKVSQVLSANPNVKV